MQLYDIYKIRRIEATNIFKADYQKVLKRKIAAGERAQRKLIMYANGVQKKNSNYGKGRAVKKTSIKLQKWDLICIFQYYLLPLW